MGRSCNGLVTAVSILALLLLLSVTILPIDGTLVKMDQKSRTSPNNCKTIAETGRKIVRRQVVGNVSCTGSGDCPDGCCRDEAGNNVEDGQIVSTLLDGILTEPIGQPTCGNVSFECEPCNDNCSCAPGLVCQPPSFSTNVSLICVSEGANDEYEDIIDGGSLYDHTSFPWNNSEIHEIINGTKEKMTTLEEMFEDLLSYAPKTNCTEWEFEFYWDSDEVSPGTTTPSGTTTPGTLRRRRRCVNSFDSLTQTTTELPDPESAEKRETEARREIRSVLLSALYERPVSLRRKRHARRLQKRDLRMQQAPMAGNSESLDTENIGTQVPETGDNAPLGGQAWTVDDGTTPSTSQQIDTSLNAGEQWVENEKVDSDDSDESSESSSYGEEEEEEEEEEEGDGDEEVDGQEEEPQAGSMNMDDDLKATSHGSATAWDSTSTLEGDAAKERPTLVDDTPNNVYKPDKTAVLSDSPVSEPVNQGGSLVIGDDVMTTVSPTQQQATMAMGSGAPHSIVEPTYPEEDMLEMIFEDYMATTTSWGLVTPGVGRGAMYADDEDSSALDEDQSDGTMVVEDDIPYDIPTGEDKSSNTSPDGMVILMDDDIGFLSAKTTPRDGASAGVVIVEDAPSDQTSITEPGGVATLEDDIPDISRTLPGQQVSGDNILKFRGQIKPERVPGASAEMWSTDQEWKKEARNVEYPSQAVNQDVSGKGGVAVVLDDTGTDLFNSNDKPNGVATVVDDPRNGESPLISWILPRPLIQPQVYGGGEVIEDVIPPLAAIEKMPSLLFAIIRLQLSYLNPMYTRMGAMTPNSHFGYRWKPLKHSGNGVMTANDVPVADGVPEGRGQAVMYDDASEPTGNQQQDRNGQATLYSDDDEFIPAGPRPSVSARNKRDVQEAQFTNDKDIKAKSSDGYAILEDDPVPSSPAHVYAGKDIGGDSGGHAIQYDEPDSRVEQPFVLPNRNIGQTGEADGMAVLEDDLIPDMSIGPDPLPLPSPGELPDRHASMFSEEDLEPGASSQGVTQGDGFAILEDDITPGASSQGVAQADGTVILEDDLTPGVSSQGVAQADGTAILEDDLTPGVSSQGVAQADGTAILEDELAPGVSSDITTPSSTQQVTPGVPDNDDGAMEIEDDQEVLSPQRIMQDLAEVIKESVEMDMGAFNGINGGGVWQEGVATPSPSPQSYIPTQHSSFFSADTPSSNTAGKAVLYDDVPPLPQPDSEGGQAIIWDDLPATTVSNEANFHSEDGHAIVWDDLPATTGSNQANLHSEDGQAIVWDDLPATTGSNEANIHSEGGHAIVWDDLPATTGSNEANIHSEGGQAIVWDDLPATTGSNQANLHSEDGQAIVWDDLPATTGSNQPNIHSEDGHAIVWDDLPASPGSNEANIHSVDGQATVWDDLPATTGSNQLNLKGDDTILRFVGSHQEGSDQQGKTLEMSDRVVYEANESPLWLNVARLFPILREGEKETSALDVGERGVGDRLPGENAAPLGAGGIRSKESYGGGAAIMTDSDWTKADHDGVAVAYDDPIVPSQGQSPRVVDGDGQMGVADDVSDLEPLLRPAVNRAGSAVLYDSPYMENGDKLGNRPEVGMKAPGDTLRFQPGEPSKDYVDNPQPQQAADEIPGTLIDTNYRTDSRGDSPLSDGVDAPGVLIDTNYRAEDIAEEPAVTPAIQSKPSFMYMLGLALNHIEKADRIYKDAPEEVPKKEVYIRIRRYRNNSPVMNGSARNGVNFGTTMIFSLCLAAYFCFISKLD